jgi:hypothetical protein
VTPARTGELVEVVKQNTVAQLELASAVRE